MNLVILRGRLGADPEVRVTQTGKRVATLSIATSTALPPRNGGTEWGQKVEWHRGVAWDYEAGKGLATRAEKLHKGDMVEVQGKLTYRDWVDKEGIKRYTTEVQVKELGVVSRAAGKSEAQEPVAVASATTDEDEDDDLPF